MSVLSSPHFHDEAKAFEYLESVVWAKGVMCPHCGVVGGRIYKLDGVRGKPSAKNPEGAIRFGLKKCGECRKQFTVKVGTVFEHARMPLHKMLQAVHLMMSSKKGISAHQLHRVLEVDYKSAWFLAHRIREAMQSDGPLLGGEGGMVEVDETYIGRRQGVEMKRGGGSHKMQVVALIDRATGEARSFSIKDAKLRTIAETLEANVSTNAHLMTDEWRAYRSLAWNFAGHSTVKHRDLEYVKKGQPLVHTNTVEGFFSIFKRGMKGIYQHCSEKHLQRYVQEFAFRYTLRSGNGFDDKARTMKGLEGIIGKRLTYRRPDLGA